MSGFTAEQLLQLEDTVAKGVRKGLSDIGLGYDNETDKSAIRADQAWTRASRLAEITAQQKRHDGVRAGAWTVMGVAAAGAFLYLITHLEDFGHFLVTIASAAK